MSKTARDVIAEALEKSVTERRSVRLAERVYRDLVRKSHISELSVEKALKDAIADSGLAETVLASLREAGLLAEWRKIEDAPKEGEVVLIVNKHDAMILGSHRQGVHEAYWIDQFGATELDQPTHFMPLPSPPRDTSPGEESP